MSPTPKNRISVRSDEMTDIKLRQLCNSVGLSTSELLRWFIDSAHKICHPNREESMGVICHPQPKKIGVFDLSLVRVRNGNAQNMYIELFLGEGTQETPSLPGAAFDQTHGVSIPQPKTSPEIDEQARKIEEEEKKNYLETLRKRGIGA